MMNGTDIARQFPSTAARVVLRCEEDGGDVQNAWDVLISAHGETEAKRLVEEERVKRNG